jgi:hypothetical protein
MESDQQVGQAILGVVGLVHLAFTAYRARRAWRLWFRGVREAACVVGYEAVEGVDGPRVHFPLVEMGSRPGVRVRARSTCKPDPRGVGRHVTVVYDPRAPGWVEVWSAWSVWRVPVALLLWAVAWGILALVLGPE